MEKLTTNYHIKAFGITREILGGREIMVPCDGQTVADLKQTLFAAHPELNGLKSIFVAVNNVYAEDTVVIKESDEIALIPPVSGG